MVEAGDPERQRAADEADHGALQGLVRRDPRRQRRTAPAAAAEVGGGVAQERAHEHVHDQPVAVLQLAQQDGVDERQAHPEHGEVGDGDGPGDVLPDVVGGAPGRTRIGKDATRARATWCVSPNSSAVMTMVATASIPASIGGLTRENMTESSPSASRPSRRIPDREHPAALGDDEDRERDRRERDEHAGSQVRPLPALWRGHGASEPRTAAAAPRTPRATRRRPGVRCRARARRGKRTRSRPAARAGSSRCASRRWCDQEVGVVHLGRVQVTAEPLRCPRCARSRRVEDFRPAAVVEGHEEGDPLVVRGLRLRPVHPLLQLPGDSSRRPMKRIRTPPPRGAPGSRGRSAPRTSPSARRPPPWGASSSRSRTSRR